MVKAKIYTEGGGPPDADEDEDIDPAGQMGRVETRDKSLHIRCRDGFAELLERCGLDRERFQVIPCGGRGEARNDFLIDHGAAAGEYYVALLIDSEESVSCINETWKHLETFFNWQHPQDAQDDQVLFMTRCMETWIAADRSILREHFGENLQVSALPERDDLEGVSPGMLKYRLRSATQDCPEPYSKGRNSFYVLGKLNPNTLEEWLPSFRRARLILRDKLG